MTGDRTPAGDLRERLEAALRAGRCCSGHIPRIAAALVPVVEAALARARASCCEDGDRTYAEMERHLTQRAEEAARERDDYRQRFANQMTAATELTTTLREAERKLQQALEAIADERRGRLAAVERVRRMAQVWVDIRPQHPTATTDAHTLAWAGEQIIAALDQTEETPPAEHTGGNAEDCPVCAPLIDQPGGVLYPWICTAAGEQVIAALPEQAAGPPPG